MFNCWALLQRMRSQQTRTAQPSPCHQSGRRTQARSHPQKPPHPGPGRGVSTVYPVLSEVPHHTLKPPEHGPGGAWPVSPAPRLKDRFRRCVSGEGQLRAGDVVASDSCTHHAHVGSTRSTPMHTTHTCAQPDKPVCTCPQAHSIFTPHAHVHIHTRSIDTHPMHTRVHTHTHTQCTHTLHMHVQAGPHIHHTRFYTDYARLYTRAHTPHIHVLQPTRAGHTCSRARTHRMHAPTPRVHTHCNKGRAALPTPRPPETSRIHTRPLPGPLGLEGTPPLTPGLLGTETPEFHDRATSRPARPGPQEPGRPGNGTHPALLPHTRAPPSRGPLGAFCAEPPETNLSF